MIPAPTHRRVTLRNEPNRARRKVGVRARRPVLRVTCGDERFNINSLLKVQSANILDAAITTAKIGSLQVENIKIKDNEITSTNVSIFGTNTITSGSYQHLADCTVTFRGVPGKTVQILAHSCVHFRNPEGTVDNQVDIEAVLTTPVGNQMAAVIGSLRGSQSVFGTSVRSFLVAATGSTQTFTVGIHFRKAGGAAFGFNVESGSSLVVEAHMR